MSATWSHGAKGRGSPPSSGAGDQRPRRGSRPLEHGEKIDLALLAMPTFALALAITIVSTQLGELARSYTHVLAGGLPAAAVLALIGFVHGLGLVALVSLLFFAFYFIAYEPYRAMYPDMLPPSDEVGGRAQSAQAVAREAMWIVCAAATFASLLFLRRMAHASEDRHQLASATSS